MPLLVLRCLLLPRAAVGLTHRPAQQIADIQRARSARAQLLPGLLGGAPRIPRGTGVGHPLGMFPGASWLQDANHKDIRSLTVFVGPFWLIFKGFEKPYGPLLASKTLAFRGIILGSFKMSQFWTSWGHLGWI